jgi:hypothetical protein
MMKGYRIFLIAAAGFIAVSALLYYVQHLKTAYLFLYSLVLRTHSFQPNPTAVVG